MAQDGGNRAATRVSIAAWIRQGTQCDAILFSVGANVKHGLRPCKEDRHRGVLRLLTDPEWSQWSNVKIAEQCGVSDKTVAKYRQEASPRNSEVSAAPERKYIDKHGNESVMKIGGMGKAQPAPAGATPGGAAAAPPAPPTEKPGKPKPPAAPATPKPPTAAEKAKAEADANAEAAHGGTDPVEELETAYADIKRLEAEIAAASADDTKAEAMKWRRIADVAQARQSELMETVRKRGHS